MASALPLSSAPRPQVADAKNPLLHLRARQVSLCLSLTTHTLSHSSFICCLPALFHIEWLVAMPQCSIRFPSTTATISNSHPRVSASHMPDILARPSKAQLLVTGTVCFLTAICLVCPVHSSSARGYLRDENSHYMYSNKVLFILFAIWLLRPTVLRSVLMGSWIVFS